MSGRRITPVHYTLLVRVFDYDGWKITRQKGDHLVMTKPGAKRPLVIKTSPRLVPITHIRTNMTTAGMSRERYFEILGLIGLNSRDAGVRKTGFYVPWFQVGVVFKDLPGCDPLSP